MAFDVKPKFVTFDMNGTLIKFAINDAIREVLGDRLPAEIADESWPPARRTGTTSAWATTSRSLRSSPIPWNALRAGSASTTGRTRRGRSTRSSPTWGPYPGVTEALNRLAEAVPLVIITNSDTAPAARLAENLQAPFEVVITAEQMGVYKPRLAAFEYMFDKLGAAPDEIVHVSASPMYDHRSAALMGIENKVYVDRGFEHDEHWLGYERITDIADLPVLFGLPRP